MTTITDRLKEILAGPTAELRPRLEALIKDLPEPEHHYALPKQEDGIVRYGELDVKGAVFHNGMGKITFEGERINYPPGTGKSLIPE
jgi:hypothetical protein